VMSDQKEFPNQCDRRGFLQTGALVTATALTTASGSQAAPLSAKPPTQALPVRKLGKTGAEVTILNLGTWQSPGLDRLVRFAYASGIRYFDTADCYGSALDSCVRASAGFQKSFSLATRVTAKECREPIWC